MVKNSAYDNIIHFMSAQNCRFHRRMTPLIRYSPTKKLICILAPTDGYSGRPQSVFKYQCPANYPRDDFAHSGIHVCVSTPCDWDDGSKFSIAQASKSATDCGDNK